MVPHHGPWHLLSDVELALSSVDVHGAGIVLIAGTGSNCFGRTSDGRSAKAGGLSHFFSDEGSGFALGWAALHLMGKMYDGRQEKTALWSALLAQYGISTFPELKQLITQATDYKSFVAKAAPVVQEQAALGDVDCRALVHSQLDELALMADQVAS
jgi:N-acetylglucosamine kinase-like BadF-type ATPase